MRAHTHYAALLAVALVSSLLLFASPGFAAEDAFVVTTFSEATELKGLAFENSALGKDGQAFYTDHTSHVIRSVDLTTGEVTLIAGVEGTAGHRDGDLSTALLHQPRGACVSPCDGHLYVVDGDGAMLRQLNLHKRTVLTIAGSPASKGYHDGPGTEAQFSVARAPLCLANGTIIVADFNSHPAIRSVNPPSGKECGAHPSPKPAPGPASSGSTDMLVHKLVLVGACSVLAIIVAYMFAKVHGTAWVLGRIQAMRDQHAGPARSQHPQVEDVTSDEEQGSLREPLALPAPESAPLISLSPTPPSSPFANDTPTMPAYSPPTPPQLPPINTSTVDSSSSGGADTLPTQAGASQPPAQNSARPGADLDSLI